MTEDKKPAFVKMRAVTLPVIPLGKNVEHFFVILTAITIGKKISDNKEPARICNVLDMESGQVAICVAPTVMFNELNNNYPDNSYVGKGFSIMSRPGPSGSKWNHCEIAEVAIPDEVLPALSAANKMVGNGDSSTPTKGKGK
jgi:hypothetical protein